MHSYYSGLFTNGEDSQLIASWEKAGLKKRYEMPCRWTFMRLS